MCRLGDIIVVKEFKDKNGITIPKHSFVVINDESDFIEGYAYDFVSNVMCSFHSDEQKEHKLSIESNLEVTPKDIEGRHNAKSGYVRADDLFYFKKDKIEYQVLAHLNDELLDELVQLIIKLHDKHKDRNIITNL